MKWNPGSILHLTGSLTDQQDAITACSRGMNDPRAEANIGEVREVHFTTTSSNIL